MICGLPALEVARVRVLFSVRTKKKRTLGRDFKHHKCSLLFVTHDEQLYLSMLIPVYGSINFIKENEINNSVSSFLTVRSFLAV